MAFFQGATRLSHVPSCCESALSVGTDSRVSAKESGVCGVDLDIGAFGLVAQPVEFLSTYDGDLRDPLVLPQESPV